MMKIAWRWASTQVASWLALLAAVAATHVDALAQTPAAGAKFRDCAACPEMVVIGPGTFRMGSPESEEGRNDSEGPQRRVTISEPFAIGVHEVTFDEYTACLDAGPCGLPHPENFRVGRGGEHPAIVIWHEAKAYAAWLSQETGKEYRLPSEAEWEYAARAGTTTARHWGESSSDQCGYANGADAAHQRRFPEEDGMPVSCDDGHHRTAPVGRYSPNAWGLHDMLGNVWEWTEDCWHENYQGAPTHGRPWPGGDCTERVLRGGSWSSGPRSLRSSGRVRDQDGNRDDNAGFRVARTIN